MTTELGELVTEQRNFRTMKIDETSTIEMVTLINKEDQVVAHAVEKQLPTIAYAIDVIYDAMKDGGRLVYCGAGTSGRLGVLDASECPPTYGVSPNDVVAIIAGGEKALLSAIEGAEDDENLCQKDLENINFSENDVLVGIAASGRTPYTLGGLIYAKKLNAKTISLTCNADSKLAQVADISIAPIVGAEVVTGSTRMKAGTAQKMVLNMLSTGVMIKLGKVYENLMVDVMPSNEKLNERCCLIVMEATGVSHDAAREALKKTAFHCKEAIVMLRCNCSAHDAAVKLEKSKGHIKIAIRL